MFCLWRRNHQSDKCSFRDCYWHSYNKKGHLALVCHHRKNINNQSKFDKNNFLESEEYSLYNINYRTDPISIELVIENKLFTFLITFMINILRTKHWYLLKKFWVYITVIRLYLKVVLIVMPCLEEGMQIYHFS